MQCISPLTAGFNQDGDLVYNSKKADKSIVPIKFECRRCLPCRLNGAREKAVRATHEAKQHKENMFLTLTYSPEHLKSEKLVYSDFQKFMKRLRWQNPHKKINYMVTGEYGELNKRPHWHALIFNHRPPDATYKYSNERKEKLYTSQELKELWPHGSHDFGEVTIDSANYVARYAAKKLVHGKDQEHDFHPIHKTSSKYGIGRKWIEQNYKHVFANGFIVLPNGEQTKIPRYYVDWLKKHKPEMYLRYVTELRSEIISKAEDKARKEELDYFSNLFSRKHCAPNPMTRSKVKLTILESKFKLLQEKLTL